MPEATLTKCNGEVSMDKSFDYLCSLLQNGTYTVKIVRKTQPRTVRPKCADVDVVQVHGGSDRHSER